MCVRPDLNTALAWVFTISLQRPDAIVPSTWGVCLCWNITCVCSKNLFIVNFKKWVKVSKELLCSSFITKVSSFSIKISCLEFVLSESHLCGDSFFSAGWNEDTPSYVAVQDFVNQAGDAFSVRLKSAAWSGGCNHGLSKSLLICLYMFVVQSLSHVWLFVTSWTAERQASVPFTIFWRWLKLMSIASVMPPNHLIFCCPLLFLPSVSPSIRVFSNESALCIRRPKYWSFSISRSNEYSGFISFRIDLLSKGLSRVFSSTAVYSCLFCLGSLFHKAVSSLCVLHTRMLSCQGGIDTHLTGDMQQKVKHGFLGKPPHRESREWVSTWASTVAQW